MQFAPDIDREFNEQSLPQIEERKTIFMNGMMLMAVMLTIYTIAQISILYSSHIEDLVDRSAFVVSIYTDLFVCVMLLVNYLHFRKYHEAAAEDPRIYSIMIWTIALLLIASLIHIHLVGSQSSLHYLLIVAILLVASWFFRWREVLLFFLFGHLGLAAMIALESTGILTYAPLFAEHDKLARVYLDWRVFVGQTTNYLFVLVICTGLLWKIRRVLEKSESLREAANRKLRREIAERIQSEKEKEVLITKLQESLDQVKTLSGLLPICSKCKNIRDDQGYWQQLESYLKRHSPEIEFTHGLCPKCAGELYPSELLKNG